MAPNMSSHITQSDGNDFTGNWIHNLIPENHCRSVKPGRKKMAASDKSVTADFDSNILLGNIFILHLYSFTQIIQ